MKTELIEYHRSRQRHKSFLDPLEQKMAQVAADFHERAVVWLEHEENRDDMLEKYRIHHEYDPKP